MNRCTGISALYFFCFKIVNGELIKPVALFKNYTLFFQKEICLAAAIFFIRER
jgi:hypothetical protein